MSSPLMSVFISRKWQTFSQKEMHAPSITVSWMCATPFSSTLILRSFAQASGSINRGMISPHAVAVTAGGHLGGHFFRGGHLTGLLPQVVAHPRGPARVEDGPFHPHGVAART